MEFNARAPGAAEMALKESDVRFEMTWFEDGDQALKTLSRRDGKAPDIILLDLSLPRMAGIDVLRIIRQMPKLVVR